MSDESRLEFAYPRIGLTGDAGATYFLPRLLGLRTAKKLVIEDEPILPADALELGLASEIVPADSFEDRLTTYAQSIATESAALGSTLRLLMDSFEQSLESQLAAETEAMAAATQTEDYRRGIEAFMTDTDPEFTGE